MAIFLYSILGVGLTVFGGVLFGMDAEWWVPLTLIGTGVFCLGIAVYKLDDEYRFISNYMEKKKSARAQKVWDGRFEVKPLNMVSMFIKAYEERKTSGNAYIMGKARSYIISGYKAILKNWLFVKRETDKLGNLNEEDVRKLLFDAIEAELVILACGDERLDDGDYGVYCDICRALSATPRTKANAQKYCKELVENQCEKARKKVSFFYDVARRCVSPSKFEKLVQGFCYLALSDNVVHENEYGVICGAFFQADVDVYPETWEQFKKEY